jgi:transposase-like protein
MRLQIIFRGIDSSRLAMPTRCPNPTCNGREFRLHQEVRKSLRDRDIDTVPTYRYQCTTCGRTFRVYPEGVDNGQVSRRVKNLAVLLYLLGLSYREVSRTLGALGVFFCKSRVYDAVQEAADTVIGFSRQPILDAVLPSGADGGMAPAVRWRERWLPLDLIVHDIDGLTLAIGNLSPTETDALTAIVAPITGAVGARLLLAEDVDVFKAVA